MLKVKDLMATEVFTVAPDEPVDRVFFLVHYEKIRHLPVVEKRKVVGIVSDRDLYKALGPKSSKRDFTKDKGGAMHFVPRKVRHIMTRGVVSISRNAAAAEAASMMARRKIGALPVVEKEKLVGIITATDLLKAYGKVSRELSELRGEA